MSVRPNHLPIPLIGAHTSTQGGLYRALEEGKEIGAITIQLFTSNQRQWSQRILSEDDLNNWYTSLEATCMEHIMSHASYLINLGSPRAELLEKSRNAFIEEIKRCIALNISYLNFHPGASKGEPLESCLDRIVASLKNCQPYVEKKHNLRLLLETTAGQGSTVGHTFEQLSYIINQVKEIVPIGVCIDTCHIFSAGYDIRTQQDWDTTLEQFDQVIGLEHLYAFHVNDTLHDLASCKDRHANLGEGYIGIDSFQYIMQHPSLRSIPKYLETPNGQTMWKQEINCLKDFYYA